MTFAFPWAAIKDFFGWLRNLVRKLRLELYYDPKLTYHVAHDLGSGGIKGMFAHVMVVNRGRDTASKCRGILSEVYSETTNGGFEPAPLFNNSVELHWAHEPLDCFTKDIHSNQPTRLDVCYAHEGHSVLHFFCEKLARGVQTDFPPGRYKIKINVRSDGGATCSRRFLVAFDGNFQRLCLEQLEGRRVRPDWTAPKSLVSGGPKLPQSAAAKKEFVGAALAGILADACAESSHRRNNLAGY
jgi:hypothetical protein